ncbi:MAG TPA: hypothetical protein VGN12_08695 [Pirellulales bacterium]|jgi:hypothetical protein
MPHAPKTRRRWYQFSLGTMLLIAGVCLAALAWHVYQERSEAFNSESWRDPIMVERGVRLKMADGLIARGTLHGMSRSAVVEMLGEPPPPEYFRDWDIVYRLGMERRYMSIDSEWLVIRLGSDGRVIDYRIVRD